MPYADPFGTMPSGTGGAGTDPYLKTYLNNTPEAGFWYYLQKHGLVGNNPNQQYSQGQYNRTYSGYMANAAENPNEGFYDYLSRKSPDFASDFSAQTPDQRNDYTGRTLTGRGRFTRAY